MKPSQNPKTRSVFLCGFIAACWLSTLVATLRAEQKAGVTLPEPGGPFAVGRVVETWVDEQRADPFVDAPAGSKTELCAWIWYPSTKSADAKMADYLPPDWQRELDALKNPVSALARDVHTHSIAEGPFAPEQSRYPVVILRGGLGAQVVNYSVLAENLASHGYVVVGFDAPFRTGVVVFPGGRVVSRPANLNPEALKGEAQQTLLAHALAAWVNDIGFALDRLQQLDEAGSGRFHGRLDLKKIAIVGHSLGGAAAAQFSQGDPRCTAGIDVDGALYEPVIRDGLKRPFMFLLSDHRAARTPADHQIATDIKSVYDRLPAENRLLLSVEGANHFSFTDQMILRPAAMIAAMQAATGLKLEPWRGLEITAESVRQFLDVHLKGAPVASLAELPKKYPELGSEIP